MATTLAPGPAIARHEQKLNLFALGSDGSLYQIAQTQPSNGWSGWQSLGNPGTGLRGGPAAGLLNVIDLFALQVVAVADDFSIYRRTRNIADEPWAAWQSLQGSSDDSVALTLGFGAINYFFTVDTSGTLQESDGGAWTAHPGPVLGGTPAVAASADGRLEAFAVSTQGTLEHQWQLAGGGWSGWFSHGNPQAATIYASPALGASADGRLELFAVGADGQLYHIWQTAVNNGWSGWYSHGNGGASLAPSPAVAASADGRLELFAVGTDGQLYHIWQTAVNNGWSGWYSHGNGGSSLLPSPAVAASADGRLEVFAVGTDGQLYHIWQTALNNGWSGWYSHGTP